MPATTFAAMAAIVVGACLSEPKGIVTVKSSEQRCENDVWWVDSIETP